MLNESGTLDVSNSKANTPSDSKQKLVKIKKSKTSGESSSHTSNSSSHPDASSSLETTSNPSAQPPSPEARSTIKPDEQNISVLELATHIERIASHYELESLRVKASIAIEKMKKMGDKIKNELIRRIRWRKISGSIESLPDELIKKLFKGCALTTVPGGSEDHLIHCFKTNAEVPSGLDALKKARIERSLDELEDPIEEVDLTIKNIIICRQAEHKDAELKEIAPGIYRSQEIKDAAKNSASWIGTTTFTTFEFTLEAGKVASLDNEHVIHARKSRKVHFWLRKLSGPKLNNGMGTPGNTRRMPIQTHAEN
ncbi:unnamed protein product [Caenorhabditis nigoni]